MTGSASTKKEGAKSKTPSVPQPSVSVLGCVDLAVVSRCAFVFVQAQGRNEMVGASLSMEARGNLLGKRLICTCHFMGERKRPDSWRRRGDREGHHRTSQRSSQRFTPYGLHCMYWEGSGGVWWGLVGSGTYMYSPSGSPSGRQVLPSSLRQDMKRLPLLHARANIEIQHHPSHLRTHAVGPYILPKYISSYHPYVFEL